jgi:hypothetical protein
VMDGGTSLTLLCRPYDIIVIAKRSNPYSRKDGLLRYARNDVERAWAGS